MGGGKVIAPSPSLGNVVEDARRIVQAARAAMGTVVSVAEWTRMLQPLADAAVRGDASAYGELQRLATSPAETPATNAAARVLIEYVNVRRTTGTAVTRFGLGINPGQVNPLLLVGVVLVALVLWRRRG